MDSAVLDFGHASIAISLLLGVLCVGRIRSYDVHETESYLKLFQVAVYGGLAAAILSLGGYRIADALGFHAFHSWYGFLLLVGPIEEGAKYIGLRITRFFYGPRLNESTDGVVYMAAVALGFSLIENFMYANAGIGNGHLLWLRLLLATPGHILFSFPMGLSHYLAREEGHPRWTVAASYGLACLNHGIYNNLCSLPLGLFLAPVFLVFLWSGLLAVLRYSHTTSPFRTTLSSVLDRLPPAIRRGLRCHQCGNEGEMPHYDFGSLELQQCGDCGHFVIRREHALLLFHRFAPEFRNLKGEYLPSGTHAGYRSLYGVVHVHEESGVGWFHGGLLEEKLAGITSGLRQRLERRALIRFLFRSPRPPRPTPAAWADPAAQAVSTFPTAFPGRLPDRGGASEPAHGDKEPVHWRDLALAGLGMTLCILWGASHLASLKLVSLHPALSETWQDSTLSLAFPKGWSLDTWTSEDGRQSAVNLVAQGHAIIAIRSQSWEVIPADASKGALADLLGTLKASELSRRPLGVWGSYTGSGSEVMLRSTKGKDMALSVFAHSGAGHSFVAVEMVDEGWQETLRPGLDLVRRTLRLRSRTTMPPSTASSGSPKASAADPDSSTGLPTASAGPSTDSLVTWMLRALLDGPDTAAAPATGPSGLPGPPLPE